MEKGRDESSKLSLRLQPADDWAGCRASASPACVTGQRLLPVWGGLNDDKACGWQGPAPGGQEEPVSGLGVALVLRDIPREFISSRSGLISPSRGGHTVDMGSLCLWPPSEAQLTPQLSPYGCPAQPVPGAGDGTEASGGPSRKPLPHSDPCWSERKLLWKELRKQGKVRPIPWGRNGRGGTCLAGRATVT